MSPTVRLMVAPPVKVIVGAVASELPVPSTVVPSGQVPQTGLLASANPEDVAKSVGSDVILETHHHL